MKMKRKPNFADTGFSTDASANPSHSPNALAKQIASLRRQAKLSQTALGAKAGLSRMPVYRLEAGKDISLRSFLALVQALDLAVALRPGGTSPLRTSDLKAAFLHLHRDGDVDDTGRLEDFEDLDDNGGEDGNLNRNPNSRVKTATPQSPAQP